jgi:hypothetical protein
VRLDRIIESAADRVMAELRDVSASVARVGGQFASPVLLARLLSHQAQLVEALKHLGSWGDVMGKGAENALALRRAP